MSEDKVLTCPKCGSTHIRYATTIIPATNGGDKVNYWCGDCYVDRTLQEMLRVTEPNTDIVGC